MSTLLCRAAGFVFVVSSLTALADSSSAPPTEKHPVVDHYYDTTVTDPYRWLEDENSPAVKQWNTAQNSHARTWLDGIVAHGRIKERLTALETGASPGYSDLQSAGGQLFALFHDPKSQQPAIVAMDAVTLDPAKQRVLLDPNTLDAKGLTAIDWYVPSHDGKLIAASLSKNGSEDGSLHIYDVASGRQTDEVIPRVQFATAGGSLAWAGDSKGFWYTRYPDESAKTEDRHFFLQVYFHKRGEDWRKDKLVLGTGDGLPRIAEVFLDNRFAPDVALASIQKGDGGEWQQWILRSDGSKTQVTDFKDAVVAALIGPDHSLYMVSRAGAPNGKVLKLRAPANQLSQATTIIPEGKSAIEAADALRLTATRLLVTYIDGGPDEIHSFDLEGHDAKQLPLPETSTLSGILALPHDEFLVEVSSYLRPSRYVRWTQGGMQETKLASTSPAKFDDAEVVRIFATSKDGTKIPISIIRKRGTVLNGKNPTLLYGYGGFGISQQPHFAGPRIRLWLDGGGVYAEASIRGGADYGERWHTQGNLLNKQKVFDDFAAAGQTLIDQKYTDSAHLAFMGGSNGGLLMGAVLTQHPQLARAVVSSVGIYDMLRVELDPNGAFNTTEFGSVKDPAQFKALYVYSPYHHVIAGTKYPAVLMTTGANDGRVNPMQSRKFTAALQAATTSDLPILLRISTTSGHGIGSSLSERIDLSTDIYSFLFDQLGMGL